MVSVRCIYVLVMGDPDYLEKRYGHGWSNVNLAQRACRTRNPRQVRGGSTGGAFAPPAESTNHSGRPDLTLPWREPGGLGNQSHNAQLVVRSLREIGQWLQGTSGENLGYTDGMTVLDSLNHFSMVVASLTAWATTSLAGPIGGGLSLGHSVARTFS